MADHTEGSILMGREAMPVGGHGTIRIAQLADGSWEADTWARLHEGERLRRVRGNGGTARAAERDLLRIVRGQGVHALRDDKLTPRSPVHRVVTAHLRERERREKLSPTTLRRYRQAARTHAGPSTPIGDAPLYTLTRPILRAFLEPIEDATPAAARTLHVALRGAFRWAVAEGLIDASPLQGIPAVPNKKRKPTALTPSQVDDLRRLVRLRDRVIREDDGRALGGAPTTRTLTDVVDLMLGSAVRLGEALALQWRHIGEDTDGITTITVSGTLVEDAAFPGGWRRQEDTKGHKTRVVPVSPQAAEMLRERRPENTDPDAWVFPSRAGTPTARRNFSRMWREALDGSDLEGITPHELRRTAGSRVAAKQGVQMARDLLGHSSVTITEAYYEVRPARVAVEW